MLLDTEIRLSAGKVSTLLADEFVEFGSSGHIYDKSATIKALAQEAFEPTAKRIIDDFRVRLISQAVALVTYRATRSVANERVTYSLRSSIWKITDGRWQMIFHQGTPVKSQDLKAWSDIGSGID